MQLTTLFDNMIALATAKNTVSTKTLHNHIKKLITDHTGRKPVPVGNANKKTGTISTYAPVGDTCPSSCPFLNNGCYAQGGNVNIHQNNSTDDSTMRVISVAHALVLGIHNQLPVRLHVSGDFYLNDEVDLAYLEGIATVFFYFSENWLPAKRYLARRQVWTYTHARSDEDYSLIDDMIGDNVTVIRSDRAIAGGAIVKNFDRLGEVSFPEGTKPFKCPAQLSGGKVTCAECRACIEPKDRVIVFTPHGAFQSKFE